MVWKCFWCAWILIYPLDWQKHLCTGSFFSNAESEPRQNLGAMTDTSENQWEWDERLSVREWAPLVHSSAAAQMKCQTQHGEGSDLIPICLSDFLLIRTVRTQRYHSKHAHQRRLPRVPADISQYIQLLCGWLAFTCPMRPAAGLAVSSTAQKHSSRQPQLSARRLKEIWDNNADFLQRLDVQDAISDAGGQVLITSSYLKTSNEKCKLEDKANSATDRWAEGRIAKYRPQNGRQRRITSNVGCCAARGAWVLARRQLCRSRTHRRLKMQHEWKIARGQQQPRVHSDKEKTDRLRCDLILPRAFYIIKRR